MPHHCDACGRLTRNPPAYETRLLLCDRCAKLYSFDRGWRLSVSLPDGTYLYIEKMLKEAPDGLEWMG
jgi:hypothetical protein